VNKRQVNKNTTDLQIPVKTHPDVFFIQKRKPNFNIAVFLLESSFNSSDLRSSMILT
jgi:hypothetical protein